jgi:hypothetical protein
MAKGADVMTELQEFLNGCRQRGGMTLSDHLSLGGYREDHAKRKSMETQTVRAITEGSYKDMRGTVIYPSTNTRAAWADGLERREDQVDRPTFTTSMILSESLDPVLAKNDWRFQATEPAMRSAIRAVATASRRKQELVATGFVRQADEVDYLRERLQRAEARCDKAEKRVEYLEDQNATLLGLVEKQINGIVPRADGGEGRAD